MGNGDEPVRWLISALLIALGALFGMGWNALLAAEPIGFSVRGVLSATDQEAQEGYFAIGTELYVVTTPKSPVIDDLKAMVGRTVLVIVEAR